MEKPWKDHGFSYTKHVGYDDYTYDSMVDNDILLGQAFGVAQNVLTTSMATWLGNLFCDMFFEVDRTW